MDGTGHSLQSGPRSRVNVLSLISHNVYYVKTTIAATEPFHQLHAFRTILLVLLVLAERRGRLRVAALWVLIGDASYAIYLLHMPLISLAARLSAPIELLSGWAASIPLSLLVAVGGGLAYHLAYERPALKLARHGLSAWR